MGRISEECAGCLRRVIFATKEERRKALLLAAGEFLCLNCRARVKDYA